MTSSTLPYETPAQRLGLRGVFIQSLAILHDAYRELNAKKLFWITMALSALVVGMFGAVGFDESGIWVFWKHFRTPFMNTTFVPLAQLYKNMFIALGVQWWLGYFALILALISTAPMFPDFLSGGAVDLYLARPLSRTRLFLTKYLVGMLFVALQVTVFCVSSFLVIGLRGGVWVAGIFLAIPIVVLIFSYLWSICALAGTVTRSTIASLLLTFLAWMLIFGVQSAEKLLLTFSIGSRVEAKAVDRDISQLESKISDFKSKLATTQPTAGDEARLKTMNATLEFTRGKRGSLQDPFAAWHELTYAAFWALPKTADTTSLMERWLDKQFQPPREHRRREQPQEEEDEPINRNFFANGEVQRQTAIEVNQELRSRSATWVIGTSLLFESAMLAMACFVFVRRDF